MGAIQQVLAVKGHQGIVIYLVNVLVKLLLHIAPVRIRHGAVGSGNRLFLQGAQNIYGRGQRPIRYLHHALAVLGILPCLVQASYLHAHALPYGPAGRIIRHAVYLPPRSNPQHAFVHGGIIAI